MLDVSSYRVVDREPLSPKSSLRSRRTYPHPRFVVDTSAPDREIDIEHQLCPGRTTALDDKTLMY